MSRSVKTKQDLFLSDMNYIFFACFCRGCLPSDASWFWRTRPAFCTLTLTTWRSRAKSPGMGLICLLYSDTCTQIYYTIGSTIINTLTKQLHIMVLSHNHIDMSWSTLWAIDIIICNQSYSIIYIVMASLTQVIQDCALCKRIWKRAFVTHIEVFFVLHIDVCLVCPITHVVLQVRRDIPAIQKHENLLYQHGLLPRCD